MCDQCNRTFKQKDHLRDHKKTHEKERTVYNCPRDGCECSYTTAFNLPSHIQSFHEEQRTFVCEHAECGKSFAMKMSNRSLERHSVVHDPEKRKVPYGYTLTTQEKNAAVLGTEKTDLSVKNKPSGTETNGSLVLEK
ncbi:hypothetical protein XELAEV_18016209mg [Xenopus laevis]|uniref:Transcription factor IIIA n=1 Tax=Xenopus laevis TaxID=8355 RepID=A0A974DJM2_XENLA|nr:hypothetical protein XELAEV_18016209mg [Xenopus laevis]